MAGPLKPQDGDLAEELFLAAAAGKSGALLELANLYRDALRQMAASAVQRRGLTAEDASSAIQQSMLRIGREADWFDCRSLEEFEGWLITILKNVVRDRLKYRNAERRNPDLEIPLDELDSQALWQRERNGARTGNGGAATATDDWDERWEIVQRSLQKLPLHYQAVIRARFEQAESLDEIAARLESNRNAVRMLIQRAVNRLKDTVFAERRRMS